MSPRTTSLLAAAVVVLLAPGCADEATDPYNVLQGGDLTVFDSTSMAYDLPAPPIVEDPGYFERWRRGDIAYDIERVVNSKTDPPPPGTGGLGPLYTATACAACHTGAGRTKPTLFTHGGTGFSFSSFLAFVTTRSGEYLRSIGRVLHDHAVFGVQPEGRLQVKYTLVDDPRPVCWEDEGMCDLDDGRCAKWLIQPEAPGEPGYCLIREREDLCRRFPDGESYCLIRPHYRITDWYPGADPPDDMRISVRTPLRHVGLGLMLAIDRRELEALASIDYPGLGISGELQHIYERGRWGIGITGTKAHHLDLTVELGFSSHLSLTNPRYPEEIGEGQPQVTEDFGLEIGSAEMANTDLYMHGQGVPARRNYLDPQVIRGERMFRKAKCHLCHTPTLHTAPEFPTLVDGTPMPMLAGQTIHPYSDFLLHDMGPALGDDLPVGNASGDEWRTAPLWGIGLQEIVSGHTHFLHDGRARSFMEAVMWHFQEEGAASVELVRRMSKADRDALVAFLRSL